MIWLRFLAFLLACAPAAAEDASLTLYTSFAEKDLPPLVGAFEKKYGVKMRVWRSASENVLQRAVAESNAGRHEVDALHTSALEMEALYREGILQPVAPPAGVQLLEGALRPHRGWTATYLSFWVQAYNTKLVRKEDLPRTFADLLDPDRLPGERELRRGGLEERHRQDRQQARVGADELDREVQAAGMDTADRVRAPSGVPQRADDVEAPLVDDVRPAR